MILTSTIRNVMNTNVVYGSAGDEVKLIADHDNVLIVENNNGFKFPVKKELVTEDTNPNIIPDEIPIAKQAPARQKKKVSPNEQSSLFSQL